VGSDCYDIKRAEGSAARSAGSLKFFEAKAASFLSTVFPPCVFSFFSFYFF
jgi:hypothetical protein